VITQISLPMTDRGVVAACTPGFSLRGTGLSAVSVLPVLANRLRSDRPTQAPAVAATAKAQAAFGFVAAANGAGIGTGTAKGAEGANGYANGRQKTQQYGKWAFRGLEPWSDPA